MAMSTRTSTSGWPVVGTSAPCRCSDARPCTVAHTTPASSVGGQLGVQPGRLRVDDERDELAERDAAGGRVVGVGGVAEVGAEHQREDARVGAGEVDVAVGGGLAAARAGRRRAGCATAASTLA